MENIGGFEEKNLKASPLTVACYVCGGKYTKHAIEVHEKQCLKKWHTDHDHLPAKSRPPEPVKGEQPQTSSSRTDQATSENPEKAEADEEEEESGPKVPCYLCAKFFAKKDVDVHEQECLKKWNEQNDKLPASKRKQPPVKPEMKFTASGEVDFEGTFDKIYENHQAQLVPCDRCGRTFAPDRLGIHQNNCKGKK